MSPTDDLAADVAAARERRDEERRHWAEQHPDVPLPRPIEADGPAVSVVITAHNVGPWIGELLDSLHIQTLEDIEFVIVDDHSSDETSQIIADFAASDPRAVVIQPHLGGGANGRNVGADHARGRYLAFCDGDDIVPEHAYEKLLAAADGQDIVFGGFIKFFPTNTWNPTRTWEAYATAASGITIDKRAGLLRHRAVWNKIFDNAFWREQDILFPEVKRSNDIVPMTRSYLAAKSLAVIPDIAYLYRARPGATSMTAGVGSDVSVKSYLRQELICRDLIADQPKLAKQHQKMLAKNDGWDQISRYVHLLDGAPPDAEFVEQVRAVWAGIDEPIRESLKLHQRAMFDALTGDKPERAGLLLAALDPLQPKERMHAWCTAWAELWDDEFLRTLNSRPKFVASAIVPRLRWFLLNGDDPGDMAADVTALLKTIDPKRALGHGLFGLDRSFHGALRAIHDGDIELFAARVRRGRTFRFSVVGVEPAHGGVRVTGTFDTATEFVPRHLYASEGKKMTDLGEITVTGPGTWSALVNRSGLPMGQRRRLNATGLFDGVEETFDVGHASSRELLGGKGLNRGIVVVVNPGNPRVAHVRWQPPIIGLLAQKVIGKLPEHWIVRLKRLLRR